MTEKDNIQSGAEEERGKKRGKVKDRQGEGDRDGDGQKKRLMRQSGEIEN